MALPRSVYREFDRMARAKYGISGDALLAKTEKGESGGRKGAVSNKGARGWFQFMPGTRQAVLKKYGIDPWRSRGEARDAAVLHMLGRLGHAKGLEGYNPGGGRSYVNYILGQKVGGQVERTPARSVAGATRRTTTTTLPGGPVVDKRAALRAALASGRKNPLLEAQRLVGTGAFTTQAPTERQTKTTREPASRSGGGSLGGQTQGLTPAIKGAVRGISATFGEPLTVTSGHRPGARTTSGNVSDHASGNGADIGAKGARLTRMGQAALIWAGMDPKKARRTRGGAFTFYKGGRRIQIIFNSNVGGNHNDHLHVGVA